MAEIPSNQLVLAFSIIIASLIVSGSVFFAVGSLNTSLAALASVADNAVPAQPAQQPTQQAPTPRPTGNLSIDDLAKNPSFTLGDPNAPVWFVEGSDFQCPFCRRFYNDAFKQLEQEYIKTGKVYFVYKDFPLSFHPMAQPSAEATRCAGDQGKAIEMHDAIFEFQNTKGEGTVQFTIDEIKAEAQKIGLNTQEFNSCLDTGKYSQVVQDNFNQLAAAGQSGTPTLFVGKKGGTAQTIVGAQAYSTFKTEIDSLLT